MTASEMAQLHAAAFQNARPWSAEEFQQLCEQPTIKVLSAPQAFGIFRVIAGEAEVLTLAVHPDAQNLGKGRALMTRAFAQLSAQEIFLEVAADNAPACALYQRLGFAEVGRRAAYYARKTGPAVDAIVLRKCLS